MDLEKEIKDKYVNKRRFAFAIDESPQVVQYWCKQGYNKLSYSIRCRLDDIFV